VPAIAHNELKLSGLVKRDGKGYLVVRNPIYRKLFDLKWVESMKGMRESRVYRFVAIGCLFSTVLMGLFVLTKTLELLEPISSVALSADGRRLATGSWGGARIWDAKSGKELVKLEGLGSVRSVAFSPDGRRLSTAADDVKVWDSESGKERVKVEGLDYFSVAFSADGRRLAAGFHDGTVDVWDIESGKQLVRLERHVGPVSSVAFSSDGRRLVTGSGDKSARVWDVERGKTLFNLKEHVGPVSSVAFSPDGSRLATGTHDGTVDVWAPKAATRG
jgi:WD40 repeat protein